MNIAFYSLHNDQGKYLGCIEVTQPVADLQEKGSKWRNVWNMIFKRSKQRAQFKFELCFFDTANNKYDVENGF